MKLILIIAFFLTACLYSMVGFGGGSTYTALLTISGVSYVVIPIVSLFCNISVVSGNVLSYAKQNFISLRRVFPLLVFSIPAAWLGGKLSASETVFIGLLGLTLFFAALQLLLFKKNVVLEDKEVTKNQSFWLLGIGAFIGLLSGFVGIGGGVFLAPILYYMRWDNPIKIAACCSLFIFVNSISGLIGQFSKSEVLSAMPEIISFWPLILAVLVGGTIGNQLSLSFLHQDTIKRLTGFLILVVSLRLGFRWLELMGFIQFTA